MIKKEEVKNILICRTDRLGDVILTLPLVTEARKIFKDSKIIFFGNKYTKELVENYRDISEYITEEEAYTFSDKYKLFRQKKIDLVINVKPRFDLAIIFYLLRVKYRIGTGYRWYSFLYNYKVFEHRKTSVKHESDYNLNLLKNFYPEVSTEKKFYFKYGEEDYLKLCKKLENFNFKLKEKFIIIHPGSGGSAKDLPVECIIGFVNIFFKKYYDYKVVLTGTAKDKELSEEIINKTEKIFQSAITDLSGKLNLKELLILTDNSKLFLANSTGPIHLAGALNKNVIGFYPNETVMSVIRWGPPGDNVSVLTPDEGTDEMNSIGPEVILREADKFLKPTEHFQ